MSLIDLRAEEGEKPTTPITLLLVEDDHVDARLVQAWLHRAEVSFEIHHVTGLRAALDQLQDWTPDLIVSDLGLPDAQGAQAAERLIEAAPDVPLVVLTGSVDSALAIQALEAGAEDYINKDQLSEDTLRRAIAFAMTRRQARRKVGALTSSLEEADSDLGEFAHMVAHDVRAPLRTSRLLAEAIVMALEDKEDPLVVDLGQRLDQTLGHLDRLVLSMLAYSGLRGPAPTAEAVFAHDVAVEAIDSLSADLAEAGATVCVDIDPDVRVMADAESLSRAIENVVSNSVKFRRPDVPLTVSIRAAVVDRRVRVEIEDNGVGIPAANREQVFRALERLDRTIDGSGLGLSICRRLLKAIGGDVWVEAREAPGTIVVLDLAPAKNVQPSAEAGSA